MDYNDVKLVNCADCGCELLGESMAVLIPQLRPEAVPAICGRLEYCQRRANGRPYCPRCFTPGRYRDGEVRLFLEIEAEKAAAPRSGHRTASTIQESDNPWRELATRHYQERYDG